MRDKKIHDMHVRLTKHDWERLVFAAALDKRTVSNYVRGILEDHLDNFSKHLEDRR